MYNNVSNELKTAVKEKFRCMRARLVFDNEIVYDVDNINFTNGSQSEEDITVGAVIAPAIDFELTKITQNLQGENFSFQIGVLTDFEHLSEDIPGDEFEYVPMAEFTVQTVKKNGVRYKCTAMHKLANSDGKFITGVSFPASAKILLQEAANSLGLTLRTELSPDKTINKLPDNVTVRQVIGYIAGLYGGFACADRSDGLLIKWYSDSAMTVDLYALDEIEIQESDIQIDRLECKVDDKKTCFEGDSGRAMKMTDPLMTDFYLHAISTSLIGFKYRPCTLKYRLANPLYDVWDILTVNYEGSTYKVPVMQINYSFAGGLSGDITAVGKSDSEAENGRINPIEQAAADLTQKIEDSKSEMQKTFEQKIQAAATAIRGGENGFFHIISDGDGINKETIWCDNKDPLSATHGIRINQNGIGFWSKNTAAETIFTGPYVNAWTIDGRLNASFITAGTFDGSIIKSNTVTADKIAANAITSSKIATNTITADNLAKTLSLTAGRIVITTGNFQIDKDGNITANNAHLTNATLTGTLTTGNTNAGDYAAVTEGKVCVKVGNTTNIGLSREVLNQTTEVWDMGVLYTGATKDGIKFAFQNADQSFSQAYYILTANQTREKFKCRHLFRDTVKFENAVTLNSNLTVGGDAGVDGTLRIDGTVNCKDTLSVAKSAVLLSTLTVKGNAGIDGTLRIDEAVTCKDSLSVTKTAVISGAATCKSTLHVDGAAGFYDTTHCYKNLTVDGNAGITGTLRLDGHITTAIYAEKTLHVDGTTGIYGATFCHDTLTVDKAAALKSSLTIDSYLTVKGNAGIDGTLRLDGNVVSNLTLSGTHRLKLGTAGYLTATANGGLSLVNETQSATLSLSGYIVSLSGNRVVSNGSTVTSDARLKQNIADLDQKYLKLFDLISAKKYNFKEHNPAVTNCGFIAQDVLAAMKKIGLAKEDFGGFCDLYEDDKQYALDYVQFIPILWEIVRSLKDKVTKIEEEKTNDKN